MNKNTTNKIWVNDQRKSSIFFWFFFYELIIDYLSTSSSHTYTYNARCCTEYEEQEEMLKKKKEWFLCFGQSTSKNFVTDERNYKTIIFRLIHILLLLLWMKNLKLTTSNLQMKLNLTIYLFETLFFFVCYVICLVLIIHTTNTQLF